MMRLTVIVLALLCCGSVHAEPTAKPESLHKDTPPSNRMTREEAADLRAAVAASNAVESQCDVQRAGIAADRQRFAELVKKFGLHMDAQGTIAEAIDLNRLSPTYGAITRPPTPAQASPKPPTSPTPTKK